MHGRPWPARPGLELGQAARPGLELGRALARAWPGACGSTRQGACVWVGCEVQPRHARQSAASMVRASRGSRAAAMRMACSRSAARACRWTRQAAAWGTQEALASSARPGARPGLELGRVLTRSWPGACGSTRQGARAWVGCEVQYAGCLVRPSCLARVLAGQLSSGLGPGQFFKPLRGSTNRYDFSSSATMDRTSVFGDPVILVAVGSGFIRLGISPNKLHAENFKSKNCLNMQI